MTTFDIAAKIIADDQAAYVVHAGRAKRNLNHFKENKIYLEVPNLLLSEEALENRDNLRAALRRSIAWDNHLNTLGSQPPSQLLSDYSSAPFNGDKNFQDSDAQHFTTLLGSIWRPFNEARKGDLVITPSYMEVGKYRVASILIGEILTDFTVDDSFDGGAEYNQNVPCRKVKWLRKVPRRTITTELDKKVGKPPAVRTVDFRNTADELLSIAYDSYIYGNNSSSLITDNRYNADKFTILNEASEIIAFLVAAHGYIQKNNVDQIEIENVREFTKKYFADADLENLEIEFASPGGWHLFGGTITLCTFVALGISTLISDASSAEISKGVKLENSVSEISDSEQKLRRIWRYYCAHWRKQATWKACESKR